MAEKMYVSSGAKIRSARMERGISEESLADRLGCTKEGVSLIEGRDRRISPGMLEKLCRHLGCQPEHVLCMDGAGAPAGALGGAGRRAREKGAARAKGARPAAKEGPPQEAGAHEGARRLLEARKAAGATRKELSQATGIPLGTISAMERGTAAIPAGAAEKLGRYFSMPAGYFTGGISPVDISMRVHQSPLLQRLVIAAMGCERSPEAVEFAVRMLAGRGGRQ